jgi:hypothetical protein
VNKVVGIKNLKAASFFESVATRKQTSTRTRLGYYRMFNVPASQVLGHVSTWKMRLEQDKTVLVREASRGLLGGPGETRLLLVIREKQLVEVIPDTRLRWVSEVVAASRNRWQSS